MYAFFFKKKELRLQFSYPVRAFLRAVVSNEPVFQISPPAAYEALRDIDNTKWDENRNNCQQTISFYVSITYNLIVSAKRCSLTLPNSFWSLLRELATISHS